MDGVRTIELDAVRPTPTTFAPFGVLPPDEGDGAPTADLEFTRADGWVNYISHTVDEIAVRDGMWCCELLNRHDTHTQTLMPMTADTIVVVAPAEVDFSDSAHLGTVRAFLVTRHTCVHLHRGTWHWGPYPVAADAVRIFNVQGRGYTSDNTVARITERFGVMFGVRAQA